MFAEGAGYSSVYSRPAYQDRVSLITHSSMRSVPDIAMDAQHGTSDAAPLFAGIIGGMRVLGIDACTLGWVAIELSGGRFAAAHVADRLTTLLSVVDDIDNIRTVGIDMPLGLVETGWREADLAAQYFVGSRRRSVFRVPPHAVWKQDVWREDSWEQANQRCRQITGHGLSRQAWGLRDKLAEANQCLATGQYPLQEVHPEVSFAAMNGRPLEHRKISWAGQMARRTLLDQHGIQLPDELGAAGKAGSDDVLDAAAAAWSAHRIAIGHAGRLPTEPSPGQEHICIQY
jgi:predicted RNase H-like nuclease